MCVPEGTSDGDGPAYHRKFLQPYGLASLVDDGEGDSASSQIILSGSMPYGISHGRLAREIRLMAATDTAKVLDEHLYRLKKQPP